MLCDPGHSKPVGVPTLLGGVPGRTGTYRTQITTGFAAGASSGFGYLIVNPGTQITSAGSSHYRGLGDTNRIGVATSSSYPASTFETGTGLTTGESAIQLVTPYSAASSPWELTSRVAACKVTVTPDSNLMAQAGKIVLYKTAGHADLDSGTSFGTIAQDPRSSVFTAIDADPARSLQVCWTPQSLGENNSNDDIDDFRFQKTETHATTVPRGCIVVACQGAPAGTSFNVVIDIVYEIRGSSVRNAKARAVDSRGMDLVFTSFAMREKVGYFGTTRHNTASMWSHVWEAGRRLAGKALSSLEQSVVAGLRAMI